MKNVSATLGELLNFYIMFQFLCHNSDTSLDGYGCCRFTLHIVWFLQQQQEEQRFSDNIRLDCCFEGILLFFKLCNAVIKVEIKREKVSEFSAQFASSFKQFKRLRKGSRLSLCLNSQLPNAARCIEWNRLSSSFRSRFFEVE